MSANVETMAWVGQVPWHGLGNEVQANILPEDMLVAAGADWKVIEKASFIEVNKKRIKTGQKALIRDTDNQILTNVGKNWKPVQNETAFQFFDEFVKDAGNMEMHTAGVLQNGRIVWVLAKVKEGFTLKNKDRVESYLLFSNPHIYGKSIEIRFTPIRVVCNNTLTAALNMKNTDGVSLSHATKFDPDAVKEAMGLASNKLDNYAEMAEFLSEKEYTDDTLTNFLEEVFGKSKKDGKRVPNVETAMALIEKQPGAELFPNTWWNAFNVVSFMTDHVMGNSDEGRLQSAWFGPNETRKQKALSKVVEYAEAA